MNPMASARSINRRALFAMIALALVAVAALGSYLALTWRRGLPAPGSEAYEQTSRRFYRGLAGLQVGLVDAARQELIQATELAPGEPAVWADLGLSYLRLGEFEPAAAALERAGQLAPSSSEVAFLIGRLETSRGRREEGITHLRRAVELDPRNLHARTALIQEVENAGGPDADAEAQRLLEALVELQPQNAAVLIERARLAAKRGDAALLRDSVARLETFAGTWPPEVIDRYHALQQAASAVEYVRRRARGGISAERARTSAGLPRESQPRHALGGVDRLAHHALPAAGYADCDSIGTRQLARVYP